MEQDIFNYELDDRRCAECKYHHWYYDENKKYGCSSQPNAKVCNSFRRFDGEEKMICVRLISGGFRCDMCFQKPYYEIIADDRYNELPAFHLHLCKAHAAQLAKHISDALDFDMKEDER